MKFLLLLLLVAAIACAIYFIPKFLHPEVAHCPAGSRFVRVVSGGGWADTDPNDPWGSCVSQAMIDGANNQ